MTKRTARPLLCLAVAAAATLTLAAWPLPQLLRAAGAPKSDKPADTKPNAKADEKKADDKKKEDKNAWKLADGWKLEVLKSHPEIHHPSVVCQAPDGRIFMAEDPMDMEGPSNKPGDRILIIHPDGHITTFADGLNAVFGLQYIDGKLYVHHVPKFSVFADDDTPDHHRVDLIDCTNPNPAPGFNDHIPSNIRLAMDGYLYISTGDKGIYGAESNVDHSKAEIHGGGIARIRPDGTGLEVYATGTRNHLDISMNAEDEMFTYDNTDDGLGWWSRFTHMVDGGFYGYPFDYRPAESDKEGMAKYNETKSAADKARQEWEKAHKDAPDSEKTLKPEGLDRPYKPYTLWRIMETGGGSACGAVGYNEDGLPAQFRGNLFHCEWGKGQVERFVVERDGGTYKVTKREIILKGGPGTLRPVGINVSADGASLIVADWNYAGWMNKTDAGRLLKLSWAGTPTTAPATAAPRPAWYVPAAEGKPFTATTAELIAALAHPAESVRLVAQRRAAERGNEAVAPLLALLNDAKAPAHARWHAIWALDRIDGGKAARDAIIAIVKDAAVDPSVRMQAIRQLGTRAVGAATQPLIAALDDNNAAVRFRAATALGRIGDVAAVVPLLDHLGEKDFFTHYAIFTALNRIGRANPAAWDPIVASLGSERTETREGAGYAIRETYDEALVRLLVNYAADARHPSPGRAAAIAALAPLEKQPKPWTGDWWHTQPARNKPPAKEVVWAGTGPAAETIKAALGDSHGDVRRAAVDALSVAPDPAVNDRLIQLFATDTETSERKAILRAMEAAKSNAAAPFIASLLKDPAGNAELVADAIDVAKAIGGPEMGAAMMGLIESPASKPELLVAALEGIAKIPDAKNLPGLSKRLADANTPVAVAAANAMGEIKGNGPLAPLVGALADKRPEVRRAAATALGTLKNPAAIDPLLKATKDNAVIKEATIALAATPDLRALDAYLDGLGSSDGNVRSKCRGAVDNLHEKALPKIEQRLSVNPLSTLAVSELQKIYSKYVPEDQRTSALWKFDTKSLSPEAFATYAAAHHGDANKGREVFNNTDTVACARCHKVGNDGGDVGPALSGVGLKYDRKMLVESVLYPSKQILDGYQQTSVKLKNNRVEQGIVRAETDAELTMVDAGAQKIVLKKSEIVSRKVMDISLMPEGLQQALKPEEFADLIAYLESLKEKPAEAPKK